MEVWKEVKDFEGLYEVSNYGRVRSLDRIIESNIGETIYKKIIKGCLLSPVSNGIGYLQVGLSNQGKIKRFYVHRLVYLIFFGEIPDDYEVNHIDHNKSNNSLSNLELVTKSENQLKSRKYYNISKKPIICPQCGGEKVSRKKNSVCLNCYNKEKGKHIPPKEDILKLLESNSYVKVGKMFGVSDNTIRHWIKR